MISRDVVEEQELIDWDILEHIPTHCECGAEVAFTDSLKQIMCTNPQCPYKIAARLEAMAKAMQVDGFGESGCLAICKRFSMISPYQVFLLKDQSCPEVAAFNKKVEAMINSDARTCELWQMVAYGNIPGINQIAYKLFGSYKTIADAYADFEKYQVPLIADLLGQKSGGSGVMAVDIYNTLMQYKDELAFGESKFNIIQKEGERIQIAITDSVNGYPNKSAYVKELNMTYAGKVSIMRMNSVTGETQFLIADGDKTSNKYKKAQKMIDKGGSIRIMSSVEFKDYLANRFGDADV